MALSAGPNGIVVEICDVRGTLLDRIKRPATSAELNPILLDGVRAAIKAAPGPVLGWALSVASPLVQRTGRLVQPVNSPPLVDELNPRDLLGGLETALVQVDNDVNWAALAEYHDGSARDLSHFFYYLGQSLGGAVVTEGAIMHGYHGLAGSSHMCAPPVPVVGHSG